MARRKKTIYKFKKGARNVYQGISASLLLFIIVLALSLLFIFNQYKIYQINQYMKENQVLQKEIDNLYAINSRLKSKINKDLTSYNKILEKVEKYGLSESLKKPDVLTVNDKKLKEYVRKDKKAQP
ncbi:MAG: FtsL-like putative cell division protein [Calditrichia bacterium]